MLAVVNREYQWIQVSHSSYHHFTENARAYLPQRSNVSEFLRDLEYCKKIIPFLVPAKESLSVSVLWHPDLHVSNILVEEMERDGNGNRQFNIVLIYQFSGWPRDLVQ
jgi:hypothetical protein